ncbi:glycosyltransferase family 4 protein [Noviherbaspirillum sp. CPCC 100848]|uniref:Glycosyltransferase family 4 protein n=1 Tax=Noviherbaspirillum album TaxID=3080276 RepID=A0ABU6JFA3_9BURK|nr:glycosyltransferase family 4 protein [Noviherbaspirillum sp. CPCC 100848]MEC4721960.1 glycosyltransferase family 4 protein [Noviherbaspirillum sp. CPCC 100848]
MKILIAHNAYQHRGGEDAVVDAEVALLREHGHEVEVYAQHNDALNNMPRATAAMTAIWSHRSTGDIDSLCERFAPDVIHVHNTFPLISPSLYWAAARRHVPVVQTLHNFRLLCPQAIFLRDGKVCEDCVGKLPWRAVTRKCYRDSAVQSAVITSMLATHRAIGTYRERITRYIALNSFARDKYIEGGLPANRFRIKPNFVASSAHPTWEHRSGGMYVGRLSSEKGLDVLAQAVRLAPSAAVDVIGSGPLEALARDAFGDRLLGFRPLDDIMARMGTAEFMVLPSICYENSPRTIVEAFSCGLPVIASRLGALIDIVRDGETGLLFNPGDPADLAAKMSWAAANPEQMKRMGRAARTEYEAKYTPERNYDLLIDIYEDAISTLTREARAA